MNDILKKIDSNQMFKIVRILMTWKKHKLTYEFINDEDDLSTFEETIKGVFDMVGIKFNGLNSVTQTELIIWVRSTLLANFDNIENNNLTQKDFIFLPLSKIIVYGKADVKEWKTEFYKGEVLAASKEDAKLVVALYDWSTNYDWSESFFWDQMDSYDYDTYDTETTDYDYTGYSIEGPITESKKGSKNLITESENIQSLSKEKLLKICKLFRIKHRDRLDLTDSISNSYDRYGDEIRLFGSLVGYKGDEISDLELLTYVFDVLSNNEITHDTKVDEVDFPKLYKYDVDHIEKGRAYYTTTRTRDIYASNSDGLDEIIDTITYNGFQYDAFSEPKTEYDDSYVDNLEFQVGNLGEVNQFLNSLNEEQKRYLKRRLQ
jgi:hypothetical protein